jgi:hypothetical protein
MFGDLVHWLYQVLTAVFLVVYVRMPSGEWEGYVRQVSWVILKSKTVLSAWGSVVRAELGGLDIPLDDRGTWVARVDPVLVVCNLASEAVRSVWQVDRDTCTDSIMARADTALLPRVQDMDSF